MIFPDITKKNQHLFNNTKTKPTSKILIYP